MLALVGDRIKINRILDYGCGSGRLAKSFKDLGYVVDCYEPMFDGEFNPEGYPYKYDLIIANQVIEHVADIIALFYNLNLACGLSGILYIATLTTDSILNDPQYFTEKFHAWWYKDDLTHISFFCLNTFEYICESMGKDNFHIIGYGANGIMLQKIQN